MTQLHHALGTGQVAQPVGAQIGQPRIGRQRINDQCLGRARQHRLPAMGQIAEPRRPIDGRADVITFIPQLHLAGVHTDPQADRGQRRPLNPSAQATASLARANATTKLSPSPCSTGRTPP